jgi:hypothetical protein
LKRHLKLFSYLLEDIEDLSGVKTQRDIQYITSRVEGEGFSFLSITLPTYAKALEESLAKGSLCYNSFSAFRTDRGGFPLFLRGFLQRIFDPVDGVLIPSPDKESIRYIRQICYFWQKTNIPCKDFRVKAAFDAYMENERSVTEYEARKEPETSVSFSRMSSLLFGGLFSRIESDLLDPFSTLAPHHSGGSTSDSLKGNKKYSNRTWTKRLDSVYSVVDALYPHPRYFNADECTLLEPEAEIPVKVITVPKTLKTPRIIAMEPAHMQYMQQALLAKIVRFGHVNDEPFNWFCHSNDQTPNRIMARKGSIDESLSTLDLSSASDRVSYSHVRDLLARHPLLMEFVDACRSQKADVPGYGIIPLSKFASMGSALTFPLEAMVFTTIVFLAIESALGHQLTLSDIKSFKGSVSVYGDDIIIPTDYAPVVIEWLNSNNMLVNHSKSFWTGKFRESCGSDWFDGFDVSVIRCKTIFDNNHVPAEDLESLIKLQNLLFDRFYLKSASYLENLLDFIPVVPQGQDVIIGLFSYRRKPIERYSNTLHRLEYLAYSSHKSFRRSSMSGVDSLMKFFLERGEEPLSERAYQESGRPVRVRKNVRWAAIY